MNPIKLLTESRNLISDPANWSQHFFAQDYENGSVEPASPDACSWCLLGAVAKVSHQGFDDKTTTLAITALRMVAEQSGSPDRLSAFNDQHTHSEVLDLFDKAIATFNH